MATDTVSALSNLLKTKYEPEYKKAFNEEFVGFQLATKEKRSFSGGTEVFGFQVTREGGVGFRGETQALPTPVGATPLQFQVPLARIFHSFQVSHDVVERSVGQDAAFREVLGWKIQNGFDRVKKQSNFAFYGDGRGILATVVTGGTLNAGSTLQITVDTTRYLEPGDIIAIWTDNTATSTYLSNGGQVPTGTAASATNSETVSVQSVDSSVLVTLVKAAGSGNATVATSNVIRIYGDAVSATDGGAITYNVFAGLGLIADTGSVAANFQNLARATYPRIQGQVISAASADLTRDHLYKLNDKIRRACGYVADTAIWDVSIRREYLNLVQPDVRFAPVKDVDAGYEAQKMGGAEALVVTMGTKKWVAYEDIDVPFGTVFAFPRELLYWFELSPLELDATTGSVLKQGTPFGAVSGVGDVFYGYSRMKGNFATDLPAGFGKLTSVAYSAE